ncbi:ParH-like protein [Catenulispora subtropica]|uniref:IrrE N-terminal-like domain-containing protein n=1 Tax=Catenulispora subtropica TaxID=450798 RepID=A0ABN2SEH3_9ACTN
MRIAPGRRTLLRRCRDTVERLDLPQPFTAEAFVARLAADRGRPIELVPVSSRPRVPCGLLVTMEHTDVIVYFADTAALHREHIILHEAAHLLCGHDQAAPMQTGSASGLFPTLPSSLVQRVLGRTAYNAPQEREAELLASLIRCKAAAQASSAARAVADAASTPDPNAGDDTTRVGVLFGVGRS